MRVARVAGVFVLCLFAVSGAARAATASGRVDSTRVTARRWRSTLFALTRASGIDAPVEWTNTGANIDLYLEVRRADGNWSIIRRADSTASRPEVVHVAAASPGSFMLGVRAASGASDFTLSYEVTPASTGGNPPPPFVTLLFSRSEITAANRCVEDDTDITRLDTVIAPELARRGFIGTGSVETGITRDASYGCVHGRQSLTASWAQLATLRDSYGWRFVSHSTTYAKDWSAMTAQQQWNETCGSIKVLEDHGHMSADGLFAYPDNKWNITVQTNVVSTCFAFGRR